MYSKYLNEVGTLLPGEGARILSLVTDVLAYINSSKQYTDINNESANIIFDIAHRIMLQKHSLIDETVSIFNYVFIQQEETVNRRVRVLVIGDDFCFYFTYYYFGIKLY